MKFPRNPAKFQRFGETTGDQLIAVNVAPPNLSRWFNGFCAGCGAPDPAGGAFVKNHAGLMGHAGQRLVVAGPESSELWECSGLTELWNAARPLSLESFEFET